MDDVLGERSLAAFRVLEGADLQFLGRFAGSPATAPGQAHQISVANDGRHVYAAGSGFDNLDIYQLLGGSTCGRAGQAIILDEVNLEAGGEVVFDLTSRVLANARGSVEMNASVDPAAIGQDPDLANNIATAQTTITAAAAAIGNQDPPDRSDRGRRAGGLGYPIWSTMGRAPSGASM